MRCSIVFSLAFLALAVRAEEPVLKFERSGKEVAALSEAQISAKIAPETRKVFVEELGKDKNYRCWPLKAVLDLAYGPGWEKASESEAAFSALDGYISVTGAAKLLEDGGCVAFADADQNAGWEPIGRKRADPGPFFVVWSRPEQAPVHEYPWPFQLASINLIRFEDRYPEVVPAGAKPGSAEARGFALFRGRCLRCHAINQQGGRVGPDLNAPKSVTSYRTRAWFKSYVHQPSKYRYTEMPDHTDLKDSDLGDLWSYLWLKRGQPEKGKF